MRIRNKIVISTLAIIISTTCFAQHDNVDSMKRALSALRDTSRIDGISALWVHYVHHWMRYMHQSDKDSAFYYQNMGYEESKKMNFINGIARAFTQKAWMASDSTLTLHRWNKWRERR